jgi:hypothetical protein
VCIGIRSRGTRSSSPCPFCGITSPTPRPTSRCCCKKVLRSVFLFSSVVDPHWFQCGSGFGSRSRCRVLMTKNWKKCKAGKKIYIFLIKNCSLLILRPPYRTSNLKKKSSSLSSGHLAIQNMNFLHFSQFSGSFWPSWIRICIPNVDPDPADYNECGSGSTTLYATNTLFVSFSPFFSALVFLTVVRRICCGHCRFRDFS